MDRFALVWYTGKYIPIRESELHRFPDLKIHCVYTGHVAAAHRFAESETAHRRKATANSEFGLAIEKARKMKEDGFSPLVPMREHIRREFKSHPFRKVRDREEYP